ncbi:hypothetical protein ABW19_dt0208170 [Dactylella cylindrospora]|nr:hypothetical protein ABW19_dt0208170 [Dactylella cylindrospora]
METINQAAETIKNTIWGNGTTNGQSEVHKSMIDDSITETKFNSGRTESDPDANGAYQPGKGDTDRRPEGPISTAGRPQGANVTGDRDINTNQNPFSNSNEPNTGFGGSGSGVQPSVTADPSQAQQSTPKHQGGDRPNAEPDSSSEFSGSSGSSLPPTGSGDSNRSGASGSMGGMKLPESENKTKGEGTGTLYEKSTGLACDGGDFDATRPGAAREAARLMDEKGVKHGDSDADGPSGEPTKEKKWYGVDHSGFGGHGSHQNKRPSVSKPNDDTENPEPSGPEKKGLAQKIKDKLHHSSSE